MAKKNKGATENVETVTGGAEGAGKGRKVMLTASNGDQVARADVIRDLYNSGKTRSEIVKILKEEYSHEVKYQIVFAATKPVKAKAEVADESEAA